MEGVDRMLSPYQRLVAYALGAILSHLLGLPSNRYRHLTIGQMLEDAGSTGFVTGPTAENIKMRAHQLEAIYKEVGAG